MKKLMLIASLIMFTAAAGDHLVSTYKGVVKGTKDYRAERYVLSAWLVVDWSTVCEADDSKLANAQFITVSKDGDVQVVPFSCTAGEDGEPALTLLPSGDDAMALSMGYEVDGGWKAFNVSGSVRKVKSGGEVFYLPTGLSGNDVKYGAAATDAVADVATLSLHLDRPEFNNAVAIQSADAAYTAAVDAALQDAATLAQRRTR